MYIQYESVCLREEQLYPEDDWGFMERDWSISPVAVHKAPGNSYSMTLEPDIVRVENKNVSDVFVLFVKYTTGSTFGRETGNVQWIGVFEKRADAELGKQDIEKNETTKDRWTINVCGKEIFKNWEGYFERLEGVFIHRVELI